MNIYGSRENLYHELQFNHWQEPDVDRYTTLYRQPHGTLVKNPVTIPVKDMFKDELEDWVAAAWDGRAPEVGWEEATRALACVEAAIRSSAERRPVTLAEIFADNGYQG
jgi:predicted dehydrogenase